MCDLPTIAPIGIAKRSYSSAKPGKRPASVSGRSAPVSKTPASYQSPTSHQSSTASLFSCDRLSRPASRLDILRAEYCRTDLIYVISRDGAYVELECHMPAMAKSMGKYIKAFVVALDCSMLRRKGAGVGLKPDKAARKKLIAEECQCAPRQVLKNDITYCSMKLSASPCFGGEARVWFQIVVEAITDISFWSQLGHRVEIEVPVLDATAICLQQEARLWPEMPESVHDLLESLSRCAQQDVNRARVSNQTMLTDFRMLQTAVIKRGLMDEDMWQQLTKQLGDEALGQALKPMMEAAEARKIPCDSFFETISILLAEDDWRLSLIDRLDDNSLSQVVLAIGDAARQRGLPFTDVAFRRGDEVRIVKDDSLEVQLARVPDSCCGNLVQIQLEGDGSVRSYPAAEIELAKAADADLTEQLEVARLKAVQLQGDLESKRPPQLEQPERELQSHGKESTNLVSRQPRQEEFEREPVSFVADPCKQQSRQAELERDNANHQTQSRRPFNEEVEEQLRDLQNQQHLEVPMLQSQQQVQREELRQKFAAEGTPEDLIENQLHELERQQLEEQQNLLRHHEKEMGDARQYLQGNAMQPSSPLCVPVPPMETRKSEDQSYQRQLPSRLQAHEKELQKNLLVTETPEKELQTGDRIRQEAEEELDRERKSRQDAEEQIERQWVRHQEMCDQIRQEAHEKLESERKSRHEAENQLEKLRKEGDEQMNALRERLKRAEEMLVEERRLAALGEEDRAKAEEEQHQEIEKQREVDEDEQSRRKKKDAEEAEKKRLADNEQSRLGQHRGEVETEKKRIADVEAERVRRHKEAEEAEWKRLADEEVAMLRSSLAESEKARRRLEDEARQRLEEDAEQAKRKAEEDGHCTRIDEEEEEELEEDDFMEADATWNLRNRLAMTLDDEEQETWARAEWEAQMGARRTRLKVKVLSAQRLPASHPNGSSDPYVVVRLVTKHGNAAHPTFKTDTKRQSLNPEWNQEHVFDACCLSDEILFEVFDHDDGKKDDNLGSAVLAAVDFRPNGFSDVIHLGEKKRRNRLLDSAIFRTQSGKIKNMSDEGPTLLVEVEVLPMIRKPEMPRCFIKILSGHDLRAADYGGKSDPYCLCEVVGKPNSRYKTTIKKKTLNPLWLEEREMLPYSAGDDIQVQVWDYDWGKKLGDPLGNFILHSSTFYPDGFDGSVTLQGKGALPNSRIQLIVDIY